MPDSYLIVLLFIAAVVDGVLLFRLAGIFRRRRRRPGAASRPVDSPAEDTNKSSQKIRQRPETPTSAEGAPPEPIIERPWPSSLLSSCVASVPPPFENAYAGKGDDRIFVGLLHGTSPAIIIADGASSRRDTLRDEIIDGGGWQAAEVLVETSRKRLESAIGQSPETIEGVLEQLQLAFEQCAKRLEDLRISSESTLLIALLCDLGPPTHRRSYWLYGFEGDGEIVLMNPRRRIDGRILRNELLQPGQKMDSTATISRRGAAVPPVVGCIPYTEGDVIYASSDGMEAVERSLFTARRTFLANYLYELLSAGRSIDNLYDELRQFRFSDDAVLGLIWTENSP